MVAGSDSVHTLNLNDPRWGQEVQITVSRMVLYVMLGHIQIALQNPNCRGPSSELARGFARVVATKLAKDMDMTRADWLRLHWDQFER